MTTINRRSVVQALPIEYPINKSVGKYTFTVIGAFGGYYNDTYEITGSVIYITSDGSIYGYGTNSVYGDTNNPIICKYWYFDLIY